MFFLVVAIKGPLKESYIIITNVSLSRELAATEFLRLMQYFLKKRKNKSANQSSLMVMFLGLGP